VPIDKVPKEVVTEALNWLRSEGRIPGRGSEASAAQRFGQRDADWLRSKGLLPEALREMSDEKALKHFGPRIERAYAARLMGASRAQILEILRTPAPTQSEGRVAEQALGAVLLPFAAILQGAR
jgi:hypothetical protein